jgi:hypothetical protein
MARRIAVLAVAAAAALLVVVWAALGFSMGADPTEQVAPVAVDQVSLAPSTPGTTPADDTDGTGAPTDPTRAPTGGSRQVEALDRLDGELMGEDDPGEYRLGTVDLDFGPDAWVLTAPPSQDYNGDGHTERLEAELDALVGQQVRLLVRLDDGNFAAVYLINDRPYRDPAGPGPWVVDGSPTAPPATVAQIRAAAADALGSGARVDELEPIQAGQVAWEASVTRTDGVDFAVLLDASGTVLTVRED